MKVFAPLLAVFALSSLLAQAEPSTVDEVLAAAKVKAASEQKVIFVHFGASWCIWCKRLDAFLDRPDIKPVFEKYFIPVKLVVQEHDKNKSLENPGGAALMEKFGSRGGLPYSAFINAHGSLIENSNLDGQNIGYPGEPKEIDWFLHMMTTAAPKMSLDDLKTIETALRNFKKA